MDYAINPTVLLAKIMDKGIAGIVDMLQSLDTTSIAQSIVDALDNLGAQPQDAEGLEDLDALEGLEGLEDLESEEMPELQLPDISIEGDPLGVLLNCVSEPETAEMGGVEYAPDGSEIIIADGAYTTWEFTIDMDILCTILNMIYLDGEPSGLGDMLRDTGNTFGVSGSFQIGEEEGLNQISSITATMDVDGVQRVLNLDIDTFYAEEGKVTAFTYSQTQDGQDVGVSFRVTTGQHEGELFTAGSVDMESAIMLTDKDLDEAFSTLGESLSTVGMDGLNALLSPVIEMLLSSMEALSAQAEEAAPNAAE